MRITDVHVHGFGLLADLRIAGLGPGLTVVLGPNEAGKSTLHTFLVRTLVGHPRANDARGRPRYEPLRGGRHGGSLQLRDRDGGRWRIERFPAGRPALRVERPDGTVATDPVALTSLLGEGLDEDRYEQVHAIDLDALADLGSLRGLALDQLLLDAATVGAGRSLRQAIDTLTAERDALWTPRARRLPLNAALTARRDAERELHAARQRAGRYRTARTDRDELAAQLEAVRARQDLLAAEQRRRDLLGQAHAARIDAAELDDRAAAYEVDDRLPPLAGPVTDHAQRLALQRDRRHRLERAVVELRAADQHAAAAELAVRAHAGAEVAVSADGDVGPDGGELALDGGDITDRQAALAALRTLLPELEAAARRGQGLGTPGAQPGWLPAALAVLSVGLLVTAVVSVPTAGVPVAGSVLAAALLAGGLTLAVVRSGRARPTVGSSTADAAAVPLERQVEDAARRLGLAPPVTRHDLERAQLVTEQLVTARRRRAELHTELRRTRQAADHARTQHDHLATEVAAFDAVTRRLLAAAPLATGVDPTADLDTQLHQLVGAVSADSAARAERDRLRADADRARARAADLTRQADAVATVSDLPTGRADGPSTDLTLGSLEEQAAALAEHRDLLVRRLTDADRELAQIGSDDAVATAAAAVERATARARELAERWTTTDLAARLLATTLERFERTHQPAVLDHAGRLLARATDGRWTVIRRVDDGLEVAGDGDAAVPASALSRGATEQLYLCLRLALADELGRHGPRLPLLVDDLLVNADPVRADGLAAILAEAAVDHQVLVFTCHPVTAERVLAAAPQAGVLELASGGTGASWRRPPGSSPPVPSPPTSSSSSRASTPSAGPPRPGPAASAG